MAHIAKGLTRVDEQIADWSVDDREDLLEFARSPANGVTSIRLYLYERGVKASASTVHRWLGNVRFESDRITRMKTVFNDYKGLTSDEINAYIAATMAEIMVTLQIDIEREGLDIKKIQTLTGLAKEARSSAQAMNTVQSTTSTKELELGFALGFAGKLEAIFEDDEVMLERIRNACKAIMVEIEGQYQNS
jgi:hypothetical protein